ncbi:MULTISPECIES: hypothetical protein [Vibrio]|uniref:hypothetical protein n=1 Tax=Vibrio TaxID=662 RepID=UPI001869FFDA|nr:MULTISPECIES: hypothetical protein [Vibrio]MBE4128690.1 hypothetical protein [Vibrio parahaemolyticus]MBN8112532.1 hypothetical protein [Vibrio vulnificus]MCZ5870114.1 hypothetical protein [Vibrio parahaemolyticus]MCZ5900458.1 hypothetical protein [Vibrio parahaemolyticus]MCZ6023380.1 hypothetical protein [Vibrio parahaemolyticus]
MSELMKKASRAKQRSGIGVRAQVATSSTTSEGHVKGYVVLHEPKGEFVPMGFTTRRASSAERDVAKWKSRYQEQRKIIAKLTQEVEELKDLLSVYERKNESIKSINEIKEQYLSEMVQSSEFGTLLNCTRQNINRLRREHKLLAVSGKNGNYYPKWQLDSENSLYPCIPHVIDALGFDNQWTIVQFFHTVFDQLGNVTPIKYLHLNPNDEVEVPRLARQYFEQTCS